MLCIWGRNETIFDIVNSGSSMTRSFILPTLKGLRCDLSFGRFRRVDGFYFANAEGVKKKKRYLDETSKFKKYV